MKHSVLAWSLGLAALASRALLFADSPAAASPVAELGSPVLDWENLAGQSTPVGVYRPVVDGPAPTLERFELHVTTLNPGKDSHPPRSQPQEEIVLVKDGDVEASINGRKTRVGAGSLLFFASHDVHNLSNVGPAPATYYAINFYTAATATVSNRPAAEWAPPNLLPSSVIDWKTLVPVEAASGMRRQFVNSPTLTFARLEIHAMTVEPGGPASPAVRHPWLELIIVKDGTMEATVDGDAHRVGSGAIVYLAPQALHSMRNAGAVPSTYYVFSVYSEKTPRSGD